MSRESTRWPPPPLHSLWRCTYLEQVHGSNLDTLEQYVNVCVCFSVATQCASPGGVPEGYTKRLDTAFSVQNIVEELHYQHSDEAVRTVLNDMSGRAEPFVEQRDDGGSDDYYLKRGGGGGAEGGGDGAE